MAGKRNHPRSDDEALVIIHVLTATSRRSWVIDSEVTCHMCNDEAYLQI